MPYSYSRVDCFNQCPMKYKFRYIDQVQVEEYPDENNPLIIGTAMHTGIEQGLDAALDYYFQQFPAPTQNREWEVMKFEHLIPSLNERFAGSEFERHVERDDFHGYIDCITADQKTLWDFKYANKKNAKKYETSPQVHLYAWATGQEFDSIGYLLVPKVMIRQKKTETPEMFRDRLLDELNAVEPMEIVVDYNEDYVEKFKVDLDNMLNCKDFIPVVTKLCDWCEYKEICPAQKE